MTNDDNRTAADAPAADLTGPRWRAGAAGCLLLAALLAPHARAVDSLRCSSRLVATGDLDLALTERCGDPFFVDQWAELHSRTVGHDAAISRIEHYEDWFYDFGPSRLLVRVRLHEGRVIDIDTLTTRGRAGGPQACDDVVLLRGLGVGELVHRCGLPDRREPLQEALRLGRPPSETILPTRRERWVYRGDDGHVVLVWLRAGQVSRAERVRQ